MISRMLSRDPDDRPSFDHVLNTFRGTIFPEYFYTFLKDYVNSLSDITDSQNPPDGFLKKVANQPGTKIDRLQEEWESVSIHLDQGSDEGSSLCQDPGLKLIKQMDRRYFCSISSPPPYEIVSGHHRAYTPCSYFSTCVRISRMKIV